MHYPTSQKRVVITGMGVLSPIGNNLDEFWSGLLAGKSGIGLITKFDTNNPLVPVRIAGELKDFNPLDYLDRKEARKMDPFTQYGVIAAKMAIKDSGLNLNQIDKYRFGVITGSGIGGIKTIEDQHTVLMNKGPKRVSPFFVPMLISNILPGHISMEFEAYGVNFGVVSACATSSHAIGEAARYIVDGSHDIMITGGAEAAITPLAIAGFSNMKALSKRNDEPEKASRPFDRDRDGFVMGEGAGMLVLESLEHAIKRGARIYAEIVGYGATADAYHITAPAEDARGAITSMKKAFANAENIPLKEVYINAHGTSTYANDLIETKAIKAVFGADAYNIKISSIKSMIGHLLGAAGAVEAIASAMSCYTNKIPPTINLDNPSDECDLDYVPHKAIDYNVHFALSNSFGFGGHNASILFKKYE